ncbi:hypothetical protein [Streptomyces rochei]|uniref:hypothetical protein n=1 Tax=Streptomyces rochei TaxID=1928 RepID=UPI0036861675
MEDEIEVGSEVQGEDNTPGPNPAWNDVLQVLPEQLHSVVTPHFQKWDQSAQAKIEAANNSLKEFEAYKPFVEHGINAQEIEQGLRLMYEINNNPENVYNALANAYKFGQQQASPGANSEGEEEEENELGIDPEIAEQLSKHDGMLQAVAQIVLNEQQAKQNAAADEELDQELNALKEKIGDYDERYILSLMQSGMSVEEAGEAFVSLKQSLGQQKPFAPSIMGSGSGGNGIPSNAIDPTKLSGKETRDLVAQMLAKAAENR